MVLRPLKYGVTTILTLFSPKYQYDTMTTQIWWYHHFDFLISPQLEKNWNNIYIPLWSFLIPTGHYYSKRDYDLKSTHYSEGTLFGIGTKVLRTLLFSKGQKKEIRRRIARQHKLEGEERKSSRQLNRNSLVWFLN